MIKLLGDIDIIAMAKDIPELGRMDREIERIFFLIFSHFPQNLIVSMKLYRYEVDIHSYQGNCGFETIH